MRSRLFLCAAFTAGLIPLLARNPAGAQDPRETIVRAASDMLERASECVWDKADPDDPSRALGAECLVGIADTAFDGTAPASVRDALTRKGPSKSAAWCGMFALGAIRQGAPGVGPWVLGSGISGVKGMRQITRDQLAPGDVCYLGGAFQHHALVVGIDEDSGAIQTIEGNAACNGSVSTICASSHSSCAAYYSAF